MKTIYLITGAAGHLGSTLVRELAAAGKNIRALVMPEDKTAAFLPEQVEIVQGNVLNKAEMEPFFRRDDPADELILIHAAGIVSIKSSFDQLVYDVNVNGTKNVLALAQAHQVNRMIYVSSVHALPELPHGQTIVETRDFTPYGVTGLYSRTKAEATIAALQAADEGLNLSVVHPSGIAGPYDRGKGHVTQLLIDYYKGRLTAGVSGGYDFVDVRDVVSGILGCIQKGRKGEGYILSNRYFTVKEILETFHQVTGKKRVKTILPMWFAKITSPIAEYYYKLLKQAPLYTPYSMYVLTSNGLFSHEKATRELGFMPRPFEETVRDSVTWLQNIGRI